MIRQLVKTNVILGGQLEWRFILGYREGQLYIKDFHIAPISRNIIFNNFSNENTLNYHHRDNIRNLYNKIKGEFFSIKTTPLLNTEYPILVDDLNQSFPIDTMEQGYDMGTRRENVSLYGKQFSMFCPFWMDELSDIENGLKFEFCLNKIKQTDEGQKSDSSDLLVPNNLGIKTTLNISEKSNPEIYKYIKEYVESINLNTDAININLQENTATITGVDCESGDLITKSVNNIVRNLTDRERPMIEQMNLIMKLFSDNHIICKQLFNFRFYFDLDDLVCDDDARTTLVNIPMVYSVFMKKGTQTIDLWDFFSNFEFVNKKQIDEEIIEDYAYKEDMSEPDGEYNANALSYLRDNECVDLIYQNKINQQTCYWRLLENESQIFNFYKGLNVDIYNDGVLVGNNDGMFDKTPMMSVNTSIPGLFASNWVKLYINTTNDGEARNFIGKNESINQDVWFNQYVKPNYSKITPTSTSNVIWMNYVKYDLSGVNIFDNNEDVKKCDVYFCNAVTNIATEFKIYKIERDGDYPTYVVVNNVKDGNEDDEKLTIKYMIDNHESLFVEQQDDESSPDPIIPAIGKLFKYIVRPSKIIINNSLKCKSIDGPVQNTTEFSYVKTGNANVQLYRYGGNLCPMFLKVGLLDEQGKRYGYKNYKYYVKQYSSYYELGEFSHYLKTKFKPIYPSINYFSLDKITDVDFYGINMKNSKGDDVEYEYIPGYQWYQASMQKKLKNKIEFTLETANIDVVTEKFCTEFFGTEDISEMLRNYVKKYIIKLYNKKVYLNEVCGKEYNYQIKQIYTFTFTLK